MQLIEMKVLLTTDQVWPVGVTVMAAAEAMEMNERSIPGLKRGTEKGEWATLIKVQRWLSENGTQVSLEELLEVTDETS